ncbi:MAG: hypothetical protein LBM95_05870 [Lactobacillales bacterium]|nr:hypothetical protein [Lactobacillales bacterium]
MKKSDMIARMKQLAHNQDKIEEVFLQNNEADRAEVAKIKKVMYENFAELLENWLDNETEEV